MDIKIVALDTFNSTDKRNISNNRQREIFVQKS